MPTACLLMDLPNIEDTSSVFPAPLDRTRILPRGSACLLCRKGRTVRFFEKSFPLLPFTTRNPVLTRFLMCDAEVRRSEARVWHLRKKIA